MVGLIESMRPTASNWQDKCTEKSKHIHINILSCFNLLHKPLPGSSYSTPLSSQSLFSLQISSLINIGEADFKAHQIVRWIFIFPGLPFSESRSRHIALECNAPDDHESN